MRIADRCRGCGLDFTRFEGSDRIAAILNLAVAAALIGLALMIDRVIRPPLVLQMLCWVPVTIGATILLLRAMRARAVAVGYRRAVARA